MSPYYNVSEPLEPTALPPNPPLSMFLLMTTKDNCRVLIWCPQFVNNMLGLCCSDTAFSTAIWYGNVLYVYAHIHIFISKEQQQMYETSPAFWKNGSLLLNVDSATLPPSGTCTQCRWVFHNHNLQAVDFQSWGDIDRLHICSNKICGFNFIQTFFLTYYKSVFLSRLQSCGWNWRINSFFHHTSFCSNESFPSCCNGWLTC